MKRVLRFFTSVKTALVLIGFIILFAVLTSLLPTSSAADWYRSPVFFLLVGLFTINLAVCTLYRIGKRVRSKAPLRIGPDIIHISLMVFVLGGSISVAKRREAFTYVRKGDTIELPEGERVSVIGLDALEYDDGRPKDWYTVVRFSPKTRRASENNAETSGQSAMDSESSYYKEHTIEVNHPLKLAGYSFYQDSFGSRPVAGLRITGQDDIYLREGESAGILRFDGIEDNGKAVFTLRRSSEETRIIVEPGEILADLEMVQNMQDPGAIQLIDIRMEHVSGIRIVHDPSFTPIIIAFILLAGGLSITFIQKALDRKMSETTQGGSA